MKNIKHLVIQFEFGFLYPPLDDAGDDHVYDLCQAKKQEDNQHRLKIAVRRYLRQQFQ